MSGIMRGTTPYIEITIDTDDFLLSDIASTELYVTNGATTTTYTDDDLTIDTEANTITKTFTADETAAFDWRYPVIIQGRCWYSDGNTVGIDKLVYLVDDMEGV